MVAAFSAFLFISMAAIFGTIASPAQADVVQIALSVFLFVAVTSFVLGVIFGRAALCITTFSGGLVLFIMWFPFQYYATEASLTSSGIALLLIIVAQAPLFYVGGIVRNRVLAPPGH
jgi:hypothetical protein